MRTVHPGLPTVKYGNESYTLIENPYLTTCDIPENGEPATKIYEATAVRTDEFDGSLAIDDHAGWYYVRWDLLPEYDCSCGSCGDLFKACDWDKPFEVRKI